MDRNERLAPFGPYFIRLLVFAFAISMPVASWGDSAVGTAGLVTCGLAAFLSTLALNATWLRLIRLFAGGATAIVGATLTLQLGWMMDHPELGDPSGLSGALVIALILGGFGAWVAEVRLSEAAEVAESNRHVEIMAAVTRGAKPHRPSRWWPLLVVVVAVAARRSRDS